MGKDEILRVRVDAETLDALKQVGRELENLRPGLDYSLSALVRAAIQSWVQPPKRDPNRIEFLIPEGTHDSRLIEFCETLESALFTEKPGVAELANAVSEGLAVAYGRALIRARRAKQARAEHDPDEVVTPEELES